jgi:hypothetical protein
MLKSIYLILALAFITTSDACVTYSPGKGTYTVDASGCVDKPETRTGRESAASRDRTKDKKHDRKRGKNS